MTWKISFILSRHKSCGIVMLIDFFFVSDDADETATKQCLEFQIKLHRYCDISSASNDKRSSGSFWIFSLETFKLFYLHISISLLNKKNWLNRSFLKTKFSIKNRLRASNSKKALRYQTIFISLQELRKRQYQKRKRIFKDLNITLCNSLPKEIHSQLHWA